jgi:hypothetical protein
VQEKKANKNPKNPEKFINSSWWLSLRTKIKLKNFTALSLRKICHNEFVIYANIKKNPQHKAAGL